MALYTLLKFDLLVLLFSAGNGAVKRNSMP